MNNNFSELIELIGSKILIKVEEAELISASGLEKSKEGVSKKTIGTVLLNNKFSSNYRINEKVVYPDFAGVNVQLDEKDYKVLELREIFFKYDNFIIEAVNGFVILKLNEKIELSRSKLKLAKDSQTDRTSGIIISSSIGNYESLKEGVEVVFSKYSGFDANIRGESYLVISQDDILFINKNPK